MNHSELHPIIWILLKSKNPSYLGISEVDQSGFTCNILHNFDLGETALKNCEGD